jgi:hypothetical protein
MVKYGNIKEKCVSPRENGAFSHKNKGFWRYDGQKEKHPLDAKMHQNGCFEGNFGG